MTQKKHIFEGTYCISQMISNWRKPQNGKTTVQMFKWLYSLFQHYIISKLHHLHPGDNIICKWGEFRSREQSGKLNYCLMLNRKDCLVWNLMANTLTSFAGCQHSNLQNIGRRYKQSCVYLKGGADTNFTHGVSFSYFESTLKTRNLNI